MSEQAKRPSYVMVDGWRLPGAFSPDAFRSAVNYKPRDDDIFIVTYPKCGTTWVQHIVAYIFNNGKPFESAKDFFQATPFLEMLGAETAESMTRPGAIKIHLPFHLTPYNPKAKYIFVTRNPKDCCVSFYHHTRNLPIYKFEDGQFDDYFELFIKGEVDSMDYFDYLLAWYEHRNDPNVHFLTYEALKKDPEYEILRMAEFIAPEYKASLEADPDFMANVLKYSSTSYMREFLNHQLKEMDSVPPEILMSDPEVPDGLKYILAQTGRLFSRKEEDSQFVRKGIVGDWRSHFSDEQNARMDAVFKERTKGTDIPELWKDDMY